MQHAGRQEYSGAKSGKTGRNPSAAILSLNDVQWRTVQFRDARGESSLSFTVDAPGIAFWHSALGEHRISYSDNPIRDFKINWSAVHAGDQFTVTVTVAVFSTNDEASVKWDADIEIGLMFFT